MKNLIMIIVLILTFSIANAKNKNQEILINGYSELYSNFDSMTMSDLIISFKFESDKVEKLSGRVTSLGEEMVKELKKLKSKSKWLKLDQEGGSQFSKKVSEVSKQRRIKSLLPLIGDKQKDFERGILFLYSVLAQSNMDKIKVLKELDNNKDRLQYLSNANSKLEKLNADVTSMLNNYYFVQ